MNKRDAATMMDALQTIYEICKREQEKPTRHRCVGCPANQREKLGDRLCPYGDVSASAPYRWYNGDFERK